MGMTMTQKILAAHAGLPEVKAGQLIEAKLDMVLGNDITTPVAINEFEKAGFAKVFDTEQNLPWCMDHFAPNKDIKAAEQCQQCRTFARQLRSSTTSTMWARWAWSTPCCRKRAWSAPGECHHRRRLPHLHLWRAGRLLHRGGLHRHGRRHGHRRSLVQGPFGHQGHT